MAETELYSGFMLLLCVALLCYYLNVLTVNRLCSIGDACKDDLALEDAGIENFNIGECRASLLDESANYNLQCAATAVQRIVWLIALRTVVGV